MCCLEPVFHYAESCVRNGIFHCLLKKELFVCMEKLLHRLFALACDENCRCKTLCKDENFCTWNSIYAKICALLRHSFLLENEFKRCVDLVPHGGVTAVSPMSIVPTFDKCFHICYKQNRCAEATVICL